MKILTLAAAAALVSLPMMAAAEMHDTAHKAEKKADYYFGQIDSNKDGKISPSEHEAFGKQMWSEADANSDGAIDKAELTAAKKKEMDEYKAATK